MLVRRRADGQVLALKLYRDGLHRDPRVSEALTRVSSRHVVKLLATGEAGGRSYELMEKLPPASLLDLLKDASFQLSPEQLTRTVEQVAEALTALHGQKVLHGDVKPANILVRCREPLDLVMIDFGVSRYLPTTEVLGTTLGKTFRYAAPEVFAGMASNAGDWWALGMTMLELALGRHPYHDWSDGVVAVTITTHPPVDVPVLNHPRLRQLCEGLLVKDPTRRWGADQVARWLRGESPPVPPRGVEAPAVDPFLFLGQPHTARSALALAMAENWPAAAALLAGPDPGQRTALATWLAQFADVEVEDRDRVLGELADGTEPADVRLLTFLHWLAPGLPPTYRTCSLALADLPVLAKVALGDAPEVAPQVIEDLSRHRLLDRVDPVGSLGLAKVDERWRALQRRWRAAADWLGDQDPRLRPAVARLGDDRVDAHLLWLAAAGQDRRDALHREVEGVQEELRRLQVSVRWFQDLAGSDDPVHTLAAALLAGTADNQAQYRVEEREEARARADAAWVDDAREQWVRRQDRPHAMGWAAAATVILVAVLVVVVALSDVAPLATPAAIDQAWILAVITISLVGTQEVLLAALIGGSYHPDYSMLAGVVAVGARIGRPVQHNGFLGVSLLLGALAALVGVTSLAPYVLPPLLVGAHAWWSWRRYGSWRRAWQHRRWERLGVGAFETGGGHER
jgi:hypothetical protein